METGLTKAQSTYAVEPVVASIASPQEVYAWFAAVASSDMDLINQIHSQGFPIDTLHPLRHTTALMEATRLGRITTITWLLSHDAAPALLCGVPKGSAIHCALRRRHWDSVAELIASVEYASMIDGYGATLLHALCSEPQKQGDMEKACDTARQLLQKHCSIDALDHEGITALHYCVVNDEQELTELLLEYRANPNALIPDTWVSPLMIAALEKNTELARLLIRYGGEPNLRTRDGTTPAQTYPAIVQFT